MVGTWFDTPGRRAFSVGVSVLVTLALSACGVGTLRSTSGDQPPYPSDGWYLYALMPNDTLLKPRDEQLVEAQRVVSYAHAAGYADAAVYPFPGPPQRCYGQPCTGSGPAPGEYLAVVFEHIDGPDATSGDTSPEQALAFLDGPAAARESQAHSALQQLVTTDDAAGPAPADVQLSVHWLPFSVFHAGSDWEQPMPTPTDLPLAPTSQELPDAQPAG